MRKRPIAERFHEKVDRSGGPDACHPWMASTSKGYGLIGDRNKHVRAHRLAYELAFGPIPAGLFVCHHCDNPPCCNPRHLSLGTNADNVADRVARGRGTYPANRGEANPAAVLTRYAARIVCRMAVSKRWTLREIAAAFRISRSLVSRIKLGHNWASATADIRRELLAPEGNP